MRGKSEPPEVATGRARSARPSRGRTPPAAADAAGSPPARVTRAGDALDGVLARAVRGRVTRPTLQRVGGRKLNVVVSDQASKESVALLRAALEEVRQARKAHKGRLETALASGRGSIAEYPAQLDESAQSAVGKLVSTRVFTTNGFKGSGDANSGEIRDKTNTLVAKITVGLGAFEEKSIADAPEGRRKTFTRDSGNGPKEYVADDNNVPTRRYAYVEKSIHQFVDLATTGSMAGRYQRLLEALGAWDPAKSLRKIPEHESEIVLPPNTPLVTTLNSSQLAVLHQWTGSGTTQRGLSLTSTPRENAVYGNAGESFREDTGVRIKIDLLKVPKNVVLLNHYAAGGIKDRTATVNPALVTSSDVYKTGFKASVIKNRELYLERLEADWIEDIEVHAGTATRPKRPDELNKRGAALVAAVAANVGVADYLAGFKASVDAGYEADEPAKLSAAGKLGFASGKKYLLGHSWGKDESDRFIVRGNAVRNAIIRQYEWEPAQPQQTGGQRRHHQHVKRPTTEERVSRALGEAGRSHPSNPTSLYAAKEGTPEFLAARIVCSTMKQHGYAAMKRIEINRWLALSTISKAERDQPGIYWVGWAHSASGKAPRNDMSQLFTA